jgi:hypothetical protein
VGGTLNDLWLCLINIHDFIESATVTKCNLRDCHPAIV